MLLSNVGKGTVKYQLSLVVLDVQKFIFFMKRKFPILRLSLNYYNAISVSNPGSEGATVDSDQTILIAFVTSRE